MLGLSTLIPVYPICPFHVSFWVDVLVGTTYRDATPIEGMRSQSSITVPHPSKKGDCRRL